jgi:hypothetical protein
MPDVVRRLVERRAPQLIMAASAGDQEVTHAPALRDCFPYQGILASTVVPTYPQLLLAQR